MVGILIMNQNHELDYCDFLSTHIDVIQYTGYNGYRTEALYPRLGLFTIIFTEDCLVLWI